MSGRLHPEDVDLIARRFIELQGEKLFAPAPPPLDIEALADAVVERLRAQAPARPALVDAVTLARELGMSRAWCYEHRAQLGAITIGDGSKARLRFDLDVALAAFERIEDRPRAGAQPPKPKPPRRRRSTSSVRLLPIAGERGQTP